MRVIYIMSQKRARFSHSPVSEHESKNQLSYSPVYDPSDQPSFDFVHVRKSHSVPGSSDKVLEVLRDMSNTHKRKSIDGHIIHITVGEFYNWVFGDITPEKKIDSFSEDVQFDANSYDAIFKNQPLTQKMSEMLSVFFQQYMLYDQVYASVNRLKIKLLTGSEMLRSLICFKQGIIAMKLAKAVPWIYDLEITEILFSDLPSKEQSIFLETKIPFFLLNDLNSAEESTYIKFNNRTD